MRTYVQKLPQIHQKHHPNYLVVSVLVALTITVVGVWLLASGVIDLPNIGQSMASKVEDVPKVDQQAVKVDPIVTQAPAVVAPIDQNPVVSDPVKDTPKDEPITENNSFVTVKEEAPVKTDTVVNTTVPKENFIVEPSLWKKAFITHQIGKTENDGVGFMGLADNTIIYAPIDGYVHFYDMSASDYGTGNMLAVATTESWVPNQTDNGPKDKAIQFFSYGVEPLAFGKVEKGDKIAVFHPGKTVLSKFISEKAELVMTPDHDWAKMDSPSSDPFVYMEQLVNLMK